MKRYYYILVLSIIFTAYLFSQTKENEIVKVDTYINTDSVAVTKIDTTVVEVDYLKTTDDTLAIDDCKKTGIISARLGSLLFYFSGSVTWDIPITCNTNFAAKCFYSGGGDLGGSHSQVISGFGLGLGYVTKKTDNVIIRYNIYPSLGVVRHNKAVKFGLNVGGDIILWKVFSIGLDFIAFDGTFVLLPTVGLNIVY
jgi:hypothetical protein